MQIIVIPISLTSLLMPSVQIMLEWQYVFSWIICISLYMVIKLTFVLTANDWSTSILTYIQQDATLQSLFYLETALHVSGGTTTYHQERKQLYLQHHVTPLLLPAAIAAGDNNGVTNTRSVDTVVCAPDDGWRYHPKHVEQFPDKINCVTLRVVGYIL